MDIWQEVRKGLFVADAEVESARFLERVVHMARRNGASLTVAHCLEEPSRWSSAQAKEVHALLRREWQRGLRGRTFTGREKIDAIVEHERRLHVASECRAEFETHCANVEVGEGRVAQCLKAHASDLSPGCDQALTDVGVK
jgi:nucleotide-binding universal stress UspA family protein